MGGRAGKVVPAGRSGQFLDPRGRGAVEKAQLEMPVDRHGFDRAGLRDPCAGGVAPRLDRFRARCAFFGGREKMVCRGRRGRAFTFEFVDAGAQKAHLRVSIGHGAQQVRGDRLADVHRDRLAAQPQELRGQGQESELGPDLGRDVVAQPIATGKPERNQQCVMMARNADEGIGPGPVGNRAGPLQLRRIAGGKQAQGLVLRSELAPQFDERFEVDRRRAAKRVDGNHLLRKRRYELHVAMSDDPVVGKAIGEQKQHSQHIAAADRVVSKHDDRPVPDHPRGSRDR